MSERRRASFRARAGSAGRTQLARARPAPSSPLPGACAARACACTGSGASRVNQARGLHALEGARRAGAHIARCSSTAPALAQRREAVEGGVAGARAPKLGGPCDQAVPTRRRGPRRAPLSARAEPKAKSLVSSSTLNRSKGRRFGKNNWAKRAFERIAPEQNSRVRLTREPHARLRSYFRAGMGRAPLNGQSARPAAPCAAKIKVGPLMRA
jgi:hypothetical protein